MDKNNCFASFYTKVKPLYFSVPGFFFTDSESFNKGKQNHLIGHESEIKKLADKLNNHKLKTGAFLITGYRGMGKTSFINEVLRHIKAPSCKVLEFCFCIYFIVLTIYFFYLTHLFSLSDHMFKLNLNSALSTIFLQREGATNSFTYSQIHSLILFSCLFLFLFAFTVLLFFKYRPLIKLNYTLNPIQKEQVSTIKRFFQNHDKLIIRLNIGNDVQKDRDILCLIAKNLENEYNKYLNNLSSHPFHSLAKLLLTCLCTCILTVQFATSDSAFLSLIRFLIHNTEVFYVVTFFLFFAMLYYLFNERIGSLFRFFHVSVTIPQIIRTDLKILNDRIESSIIRAKNTSINSNNVIGGSYGISVANSYDLANIREIELELIRILENMNSSIFNPVSVVIVFDELDKITPLDVKESEDDFPEFDSSMSGFPDGGTSRNRKTNILNLLANLKYFITTAKTKFIFISGRELYDAYLADVSDREFSISSIFNEVIYIDSFLSGGKDNITSKIEEYVCRRVIDTCYMRDHKNLPYSLKTYRAYLKSDQNLSSNLKLDDSDVNKAIRFLNSFILYLTHVSNGSPKKITTYFEKFVIPKNIYDSDNKKKSLLTFGRKKNQYYLKFDESSQLEISFIQYIAYPVIMTVINRASRFNDKLLISTLFLINHIYKYHNTGFSWRNLEYTPDLLEVNRTPELRNFINSIISFLKHTHLTPVISGLYEYKFPNTVSEEISMFSKFSELISASFNFTLDESYSAKKYYSNLLKYYQRSNNGHNAHVISGLHHILGDLHMADEEYTEAIFEYQESISSFTPEMNNLSSNDTHYATHILLLTRNMLKLGLAFEKRKTYSSAYITYQELVTKLVEYRWFDETRLKLKHLIVDDKNILVPIGNRKYDNEASGFEIMEGKFPPAYYESKDMALYMSNRLTPQKSVLISKLSLFEDVRLSYQALLAKLFILEKMELGGISSNNIKLVINEFNFLLRTSNKQDRYIIHADFYRKLGDILFYKNKIIKGNISSYFDGLLYFGFDIYEKFNEYWRHKYRNENDNKSVQSKENCILILKSVEYDNNSGFIKTRNKNVKATSKDSSPINADSHLANIFRCHMFNRLTIDGDYYELTEFFRKIKETKISYNKVEQCIERRSRIVAQKRQLPCHACHYYNDSLRTLMVNQLQINFNEPRYSTKSLYLLNILNDKSRILSFRENDLIILASVADNMGNITLSCSDYKDVVSPHFLNSFFGVIKNLVDERLSNRESNALSLWPDFPLITSLEKSILYFWAAAEAYKYASKFAESSLCYKKILALLIEYMTLSKSDLQYESLIKDVRNNVVNRAIQCKYSHYEHISMVEIQQIKSILEKDINEYIPLDQSSVFSEIHEIICMYNEFVIKLMNNCLNTNGENVKYKLYKQLYAKSSFLINGLNCTIYQQIVSLRLKALINRDLFSDLMKSPIQEEKISFEDSILKKEYAISFYKRINSNLDGSNHIIKEVLNIFGKNNINASFDIRLDLLEFLVIDSISCLTKIVSTITPFTKTTLFTHSYIADIYYQLFEWTSVYELLYILYTSDRLKILSKIKRIYEARTDENNDVFNGEEIKKDINQLVAKIPQKVKTAAYLKTKLESCVDDSIIHNINLNYWAEMAIKEYIRAQEMNNQGETYKEMIGNFYILDDDLNNDTYKYYLSIERYVDNCNFISNRLNSLKKLFRNSSLYNAENYLSKNES